MSFMLATPDLLTAAATDLAGIGSGRQPSQRSGGDPNHRPDRSRRRRSIPGPSRRCSAPTARLTKPSAAKSRRSTAGYAAAEAANANPFLDAINAPFQTILGRPLIGGGADGTTNAQGVGTPRRRRWNLVGNGGRGGDSTAIGVSGGAGGDCGMIGNGGMGGNGGPAGDTVRKPTTLGPAVKAVAGGWLIGNGGTGGTGGFAGVAGGEGGYGGGGGPAIMFGTGEQRRHRR